MKRIKTHLSLSFISCLVCTQYISEYSEKSIDNKCSLLNLFCWRIGCHSYVIHAFLILSFLHVLINANTAVYAILILFFPSVVLCALLMNLLLICQAGLRGGNTNTRILTALPLRRYVGKTSSLFSNRLNMPENNRAKQEECRKMHAPVSGNPG